MTDKVNQPSFAPNVRTWKSRKRIRGAQGRKLHSAEFQHELFHWFLGIRKSVKGRLWTMHVKSAAHVIMKRIIKFYKDKSLPIPPMPKINKVWLMRFRRRFGISFRRPNKRYKVSRRKIMSGLKITWLNVWRARYLFRCLYGKQRRSTGNTIDPVTHQVDQKPLHFNEAESKNLKTCDFGGSTDIVLKTNFSDSRSRLTANTMVTHPSPPTTAGEVYQPSLELLFKGKTNRVLKGLVVPHSVDATLRNSESGSYDLPTFLAYLRTHLPEMTPERVANNDYRILALDAFEVHKCQDVQDLAMSRGFVVIYHRGGTTAVGQWNDTDLHLLLEQQFTDLEALDFNQQLVVAPWKCPTRSRQAILNDMACVWSTIPHATIGKNAAMRTGWGIALPEQMADGSFATHASEDGLVSREAREFFDENNMPEKRAKDLEVVHRAWADGKITSWSDVAPWMLPFESDDVLVEGQEMLDDGDRDAEPYNDNDSLSSIADGEEDLTTPPAKLPKTSHDELDSDKAGDGVQQSSASCSVPSPPLADATAARVEARTHRALHHTIYIQAQRDNTIRVIDPSTRGQHVVLTIRYSVLL